MVRALLDSLAALEMPLEDRIDVVLVENGHRPELTDLSVAFSGRGRIGTVHHVFEPNIGISRARNAALEFVALRQYTHTAFVDDDEVVDPLWLVELAAEMDRSKADLVGGPVRPFLRARPQSMIRRSLWQSHLERSARFEKRSAELAANGEAGKVLVSTNNWLMRTDFWKTHGLRFSLAYNLSGGEDMDFFYRAKNLGAVTSWAARAIVMEEIPETRLSIRRQFETAREKAIFSYQKRHGDHVVAGWLRLPGIMAYKGLAGLFLMVLAPLTRGRTLLSGIRALGTAHGSLLGALGRHTEPYANVVGD